MCYTQTINILFFRSLRCFDRLWEIFFFIQFFYRLGYADPIVDDVIKLLILPAYYQIFKRCAIRIGIIRQMRLVTAVINLLEIFLKFPLPLYPCGISHGTIDFICIYVVFIQRTKHHISDIKLISECSLAVSKYSEASVAFIHGRPPEP